MASRAGLDREAVVRAAAGLADERRGGEVTLGELAAHLGVKTPSLYNHVAGQEGLRQELALLGLRELAARLTRAALGRSGEEAILAVAVAYRAFARERPGLYAATLRAPDPANRALVAVSEELIAVVQAVLAPYGLQGEEPIHAIRGLRSLLHGFVALELAGGFEIPIDLDASFDRLVHVYITGLDRQFT